LSRSALGEAILEKLIAAGITTVETCRHDAGAVWKRFPNWREDGREDLCRRREYFETGAALRLLRTHLNRIVRGEFSEKTRKRFWQVNRNGRAEEVKAGRRRTSLMRKRLNPPATPSAMPMPGKK